MSPNVDVHQVLVSLGYGDAIGHEVLGIQRALRGAGYRSEIFVESADPRLEAHTRDYWDLRDASSPDNILIHHFSLGSRASRLAFALPDRMILVYHNITPPEYFIGVHKLLAYLCYMGRRELTAYASRCDLALGDSEFNRQELEALGFPRTAVLPVVPDFSHLDVPPGLAAFRPFDDELTNVLFVGRVIPNKRIEDVIRFFHAYQSGFNPRSRLIVAGDHRGFERYLALLHRLVHRLGARDVYFTGHVPNEELNGYYEVADVFLCASEHEGFCVPLVEAFHKAIPVVAFAAAAVPATMDGGGVLYTSKEDPRYVAALIDAVVSDRSLRESVLDAQDAALDRLVSRDFAGTLLGHVDRVLRSPRPPAHRVAADFWDQFRLAEEMAELRQYRPAAFKALPLDEEARRQVERVKLGATRPAVESGPPGAESGQPGAVERRAPNAGNRRPGAVERREPRAESR